MLIRSQDKRSVVNFDNYDGLAISYQSEKDFALCAVKEIDAEKVSHLLLGNFSTEKACLDVMDNICSAYQYTKEYTATCKGGVQPEFVFEVPEEIRKDGWEATEIFDVYRCPLCKTEMSFDIKGNYTPEKCPICGGIVRREENG